MKSLLSLALCSLALYAQAASTYSTFTSSGTAGSTNIVPADPLAQIRVCGLIVASDLATSTITLQSGTTPATCTLSNANGTTVTVSATNGLAAADVLIVQKADGSTNCSGVIASFTGPTNIVLTANLGCATVPGDQVYKLGAATTLKVGASTNVAFMGEAVFVGDRGRPVRCIVSGTSWSQVQALTVHYDN